MRHELADLGIPETVFEQATNVIKNFNEQGFDANKIVPIASTTLSLQEEVTELSKHVFRLEILYYNTKIWFH